MLGGAYPSADRATAGGSPSNDIYATSFTITLLGGSGNFQNYKVTEYDASPGTDTCVTDYMGTRQCRLVACIGSIYPPTSRGS